jgi:hypothetical protein
MEVIMNKRKSLEGQYYGTLYEMSCQLFKKVRSCLTLSVFISAIIIIAIVWVAYRVVFSF